MFFRDEVREPDTTKAEMLKIANSELMTKVEQCFSVQELNIRKQLTSLGIFESYSL